MGYMKRYPDIAEAFARQDIHSGYAHWTNGGLINESRMYSCNPEPTANAYSESACEEGEELYKMWYPDVAAAIPDQMESAFDHWISHGKQEGRVYFCKLV